MSNPKVSIIILNWNGWIDTTECLKSLSKIDYDNYDLILVDNGSRDASIDEILKYSSEKYNVTHFVYTEKGLLLLSEKKIDSANINYINLLIVENKYNYGFAEGNNIAIRLLLGSTDPEFILLLNNDTIVNEKFLLELIIVARSDNRVGIVGPRIFRYDIRDIQTFSEARINLWKGGLPECYKHEKIEDPDMISGCCMLIRKNILQDVGLLNTTYFFGLEDADFCIKARQKGYKIMYNPNAIIWHKVGSSYGGLYFNNPSILKEAVRNQLIFLSDHASRIQLFVSFPFLVTYWIYILIFKSKDFDDFLIKYRSIKNGIINFLEYIRNEHYIKS